MAANPTTATTSPLLDDASLPQLLEELDALLDGGITLSLFDDDAAITANVTPTPSPLLSVDDGLTSRPTATATELHTSVAELPEPSTNGKASDRHGQSAKLSSRARLQLDKEYVRAQVSELETQLKLLKQQHRVDSMSQNAPGFEDTKSRVQDGLSNAVWEKIASRQANDKRAAQEENMKLRALVEDQLRVVHSLEKILLKRSIESPRSLFDSNKRARVMVMHPEEGSMLVESSPPSSASVLDQLFAETNDVMAACGLADTRADGDDAVVRLDENGALCLECTLARVLPFSPQEVASVAWKSIAGCRVEWNSGYYCTTKRSPDEFGVEYKASSQVRRMSATFHGRGRGARRKEEGGSFHFVWQMKTTATGPAFRDQRVGLHERSYVVLTPLIGFDRTTSTVFKSCVRSWPEWDDDDQQRPPTKALIDLVLSSCNRNVKTVLQTIENALLERESTQERHS